MESSTRRHHYLAYFFGGAFLANAVPHLFNGMSGRPFQSPFADPPGEGLSSATVNVAWGLFNLLAAYLLLARVGRFDPRKNGHAAVVAVAVIGMALGMARHFGKFHGGDLR